MRQDARVLDRIFDEQVVRGALDVVVDVHAVDHEHVVVAEAAGERQLAGIERVRGDAGRELGDVDRPPSNRQQVDVAFGPHLGCGCLGERRRHLRRDRDRLLERFQRHGRVDAGDGADVHLHAFTLRRLETRDREGDAVGARGQAGEVVDAVAVRNRLALTLERR